MYDITLVFPRSPFLINEAVFPPLGILYLASYLELYGGLSVQCLDFGLPGTSIDDIDSSIVGISFTTPQRNEAYSLAQKLKKRGHVLIAGGPHPTHRPNECYDCGFDVVIRGEGEEALLSLLHTMFGRESNVPKFDDVNDYPFPNRRALPIKDYKYFIDGVPATVLMSSRGCPFNCSFCARITKNCRIQSYERTAREIEFVNQAHGFEAFMFFDDVFTFSKIRLQKLAERFVHSDFKFRCFSRTNLLDSVTCYDLSKMGVVEVGLGVESGSDSILSANLKGTTRKANEEAVRMLRRYGIRAKAFLIVGLPGETRETIEETVSWIEEAQPDDIDVSVFQPLPGSPIFEYSSAWDIEFSYNDSDCWYKGKPGEYVCNVRTKGLSSDEIVWYRDLIEQRYKPKDKLK